MLREPSVTVLADVCEVLLTCMAVPASGQCPCAAGAMPALRRSSSHPGYFDCLLSGSGRARACVRSADLGTMTFAVVMHGVLEDVQQRLLYRATAMADAEIARFAPRVADLDFPRVLVDAAAKGAAAADGDASATATAAASADVFPTVATTVDLLNKLYRCVNVRSHPP